MFRKLILIPIIFSVHLSRILFTKPAIQYIVERAGTISVKKTSLKIAENKMIFNRISCVYFFIFMLCLLWVGCQSNSSNVRTQQQEKRLPADYRTCTSSQECVVVYTISGLTHLPQKGDSCASKCTFGIAKHAQETWEQLRTQAHKIPCDMEMEPCPPKTDWSAQCIQNQCESVYKRVNPQPKGEESQ